MTQFYTTIPLALGLTAVGAALAAEPGYTTQMLDVAHRDTALEVHLWYPATAQDEITLVGANAVFTGAPAFVDAPPQAGTYPMILLSHGSGGNAANLSWIAGALAERGFVVAATNHPRTTSRDSIPLETVKVWERPMDLSALIDAGLAGDFNGLSIDANAIGALGFSLGGHSVLSLAGAEVSQADYTTYCTDMAQMMDCVWLRGGGVVFEELDDPRFEQSNGDPRLSAVSSVDPALSQAYVTTSLQALQTPVQLINLGVGAGVPAAVDAAHLAPHIHGAELNQIADASHFSFLGECTWKGSAILRIAGEEAYCADPGTRARDDIHGELQATIGGFFERTLMRKDPQG